MLTIGDKFPSFDLKAVVSTDPKTAFKDISDKSDAGKWKVVFFWPKDFTFVCPTEIAAFGKLNREFADRDAVLYGVSTDSGVRAPGLAPEPRRPEGAAVPDAGRPQARALASRSASSTRAKACACAPPSSSIPRASSASCR